MNNSKFAPHNISDSQPFTPATSNYNYPKKNSSSTRTILSITIPIASVFIVFILIIIFIAIPAINTSRELNAAPVQSAHVEVLKKYKSFHVSGGGGRTRGIYFKFPDGSEKIFNFKDYVSVYNNLKKSDTGILTYKETQKGKSSKSASDRRFISFEKDNDI